MATQILNKGINHDSVSLSLVC